MSLQRARRRRRQGRAGRFKRAALFENWLYRNYCWICRKPAGILTCARCGAKVGRWYISAWPPLPPPFKISASVTAAGEKKPYFESTIGPSISKDGTIATAYHEIDKRDPDKSNRRRRRKVTLSNGRVVKDIDVPLGAEGHGPVGVVKYPPAPPPPNDPMTIRAGVKQPFT